MRRRLTKRPHAADQISLPNPKPNVPGIAKRNHLKKPGSYSAQLWPKHNYQNLKRRKSKQELLYRSFAKHRSAAAVEELKMQEKAERARERDAWSLTGFLSFYLSFSLRKKQRKSFKQKKS
jgi:hypothetical protein